MTADWNSPAAAALLDGADETIDRLERRWPTLVYLPSLRQQIALLRVAQRGDTVDLARLRAINIGVIATRDVEDRDPAAAALLHEVAALARALGDRVPLG